MNHTKDKNKISRPVVFLNIFPKPKVKEEIFIKQQSHNDTALDKQHQSSEKIQSSCQKIRQIKDMQNEDSDSLYEPSQSLSDQQVINQKPYKKIKMQNSNSNLKIEKIEIDKRKIYKSRLRVRDFQVISREQYEEAKPKPKKQSKVKIMAFDVDESCEICM